MRTKISGTRIRDQAIILAHLNPALRVPEGMLLLNYATHNHSNKVALDRIRYTGTQELVDLRDSELALLELVTARRNGKNLGGTIDDKADRNVVQAIDNEVIAARGIYGTLIESIRSYGTEITATLASHIGVIGHYELDAMYADYVTSKNGMASLNARLDGIGTGTGGGTGGGTTIVTTNPWTYRCTIGRDINGDIQRIIPIPHAYTPNANTIQVFEGPLLMAPGISQDYVETDNTTITFNYDLPEGSILTIKGVSTGTLFYWSQTFRATLNQKVFRVLDTYNIGLDELSVYDSGMLMSVGVDYEETLSDTITFIDALPMGAQIVISRRR